MDRPILVIHGVANPTYEGFDKSVKELAEGLPSNWRLIRGYWGDIGAPYRDIEYAVPQLQHTWWAHRDGSITKLPIETLALDARPNEPMGRALVSSAPARPRSLAAIDPMTTVAAAASDRFAELGQPRPPEEVHGAVQAAFAGHPLPATAASSPSLVELGRTIADRAVAQASVAGAASTDAAGLLPGPLQFLVDAARKVAETADDIASGVVDLAGGGFMQVVREKILKGFGEGIGDVLYYQAHQQDIQDRIQDCIEREGDGFGFSPDKPIPVVAHSLGGIIAWDMAIRSTRPIYPDPLITFGSQSSIIEIFSPRPYEPWVRAGNFKGSPLPLPPTIRRWFNFWDPIDPLAYSAERVFKTAAEDGVKDIHDPWDDRSKDLFSHDDYWHDPVFRATVRRILSEAD